MDDEAQAEQFLVEHGLSLQRFSKAEKKQGKTPDFRVFSAQKFLFYCEVKSVQEDRWLENQLEGACPGVLVGGARKDPVYNRLTSDIHTAVKQFDAVNGQVHYPNVLVFVNHDDKCGVIDLIAVLTGNALTASGRVLPLFRKFSQGRVRNDKTRVHLFVWLDDFKGPSWLFNETLAGHHSALCSHFGIDPSGLRRIAEDR